MKLPHRVETLSPWALRPTIKAPVFRPEWPREVPGYLQPHDGDLLTRGAGTAYGDACVNADGYHLSTLRLNKILSFNPLDGQISCQGGVTLADIIQVALPHGWFLRASPGTMSPTVGGCFACDVHGKNHHAMGSFASQIIECEILTANGDSRICSAANNADLFWATAGGLGQTGVIVRVRMQLMRVESAYLKTRHIATKDLDDTFAQIEAHPSDTYSVCWIDSLAKGTKLGRSVLMLAEHATREELTLLAPEMAKEPFKKARTGRLSVPFCPPRMCSGAWVWKMFNGLYYRATGRHAEPRIVHFQPFFYPLDTVAHWNRIYGRAGFLEYQLAVPLAGGRAICREVLEALANSGNGSFLAVIKKFRARNAGPLSFPMEGYTLAVDMRYGGRPQAELLHRLDRKVADAGGRIYMVKDSRMDPGVVDAMYPRRRQWRDLVNDLDPRQIFTSNLVRRLRLRA